MKLNMIRNFDIKDIEDIVEIENKSFPKSPYDRDTILKYSAIYAGSFFVYEENEKVIGYVIFEPSGHVISIALSHRRKGIGTELMEEVLKNLKTAWIEVKSRNLIAQKFYENLGFKKKGHIKNYYRTGDGLIMVYEQINNG